MTRRGRASREPPITRPLSVVTALRALLAWHSFLLSLAKEGGALGSEQTHAGFVVSWGPGSRRGRLDPRGGAATALRRRQEARAEAGTQAGSRRPAAKPAPKAPAPEPKNSKIPDVDPQLEPEEPPPPLDFVNETAIVKDDGTLVHFYRTNFAEPKSIIAAVKALGFEKLPGLKPLREIPGNTNQIVIEGEEDAVFMLLDAIAYFDIATPQVFIETRVIEVTYDSNFEFGVDYLHDRDVDGLGPSTFFRGASANLNPPSFTRSLFPPGFPFQGSTLSGGFVGETLEKFGVFNINYQALQINGKAEVLSKPSIIATQGVKATVTTVEETPILQIATADRNNEQFRQGSVKTGVTLEVTPNHIGESFVTLQIKPEVRGAAALAAARPGGTFAPIQTLRSANTQVTLGDGETLVIGGLYTNQSTTEKAKTPFLSDIPFLGDLFTRTKETKQKTELIFILTPHIVRKTSDLKIVTPPKELQRLEDAAAGKDSGDCCYDGRLLKPKCVPKLPGWGAHFEDP